MAKNAAELLRLMHHSMNGTAPPENYKTSADDTGQEYLAPGGHTMAAVFAVATTAVRTVEEVAGTPDEGTWLFIDAVRALPEGARLNLKVESKKSGSIKKQKRTSEVQVSSVLTQLIAGAPTLAIVVQQATPVLGHKVCKPPSM